MNSVLKSSLTLKVGPSGEMVMRSSPPPPVPGHVEGGGLLQPREVRQDPVGVGYLELGQVAQLRPQHARLDPGHPSGERVSPET